MICKLLDFVGSNVLWISGVLNDIFVSCVLRFRPSKPTISFTVITFASVRACFSLLVSCLWSVLHFSQFSFNKIFTFSLLQFVFIIFAIILRKLYFLNRYKFLIRALSLLLNDTLRHRYIVSALKIYVYDNFICFCLQTSEMYVTLNII